MKTMNCPFCGWVEKWPGHYASHYAHRRHLKECHPLAFTEMEKAEQHLKEQWNEAHQMFGMGLRPLNMLR